MAHNFLIHNNPSSGHYIYLNCDSFTIKESDNKLNVSLTNISMTLKNNTAKYFDFHYKAFLVVEFYKGKIDEQKSNLIKTLGADKVYEYLKNSTDSNKSTAWATTTTKPSSGTYFQKYKANYLLAYHDGYIKSGVFWYTDNDGNDHYYHDHWTGEDFGAVPIQVPKSNQNFSFDIPSGATKAKVYIYGDSDPSYYWLDVGNGDEWHQSLTSCPCETNVTEAHKPATIQEYDLVVEPIWTGIKYTGNLDGTVMTKYSNGGHVTNSYYQGQYNTFSATIPPFSSGTGNSLNGIHGSIDFRKANVPLGKYIEITPEDNIEELKTKDRIKVKLKKWTDTATGKEMSKYVVIPDTQYTTIYAVGSFYKLENNKYVELLNSQVSSENNPDGTSPVYYKKLIEDKVTRVLVFNDQKYLDNRLVINADYAEIRKQDPNFFGVSTWANGTDNLKVSGSTVITPIKFNEGIEGEEEAHICGTSSIWIDFFAMAEKFTPTGLYTYINDNNQFNYFIRLDNFEKPSFYTGKDYSWEYFDRSKLYYFNLAPRNFETYGVSKPNGATSKGWYAEEKNEDPALAITELPVPAITSTAEVEISSTKNIKSFIPIVENVSGYSKTELYYMTNRFNLSGDIRKGLWVDTGTYSIPRAPKKLWYESAHKNKTYVSDSEEDIQSDLLGSSSRVYKEDLRPRIKDPFVWRWDQALGDIYEPDEPSSYRVYLYKKTKNSDGSYTDPIRITNTDKSAIKGLAGTTVTPIVPSENPNNVCYDVVGKHLCLDLKALGFKSGDYCGCKIVSFVTRTDPNGGTGNVYSNVHDGNGNISEEIEKYYAGIFGKPIEYTVTPAAAKNTNYFIGNSKDKSLYGPGGYVEDYPNDKSFAEGGCPALVGPNDEKIGYDYIESFTDCEVRNGATVWVKLSDTNEPEKDWVEGTPWVKTEDGWKEADSLHVKTNNSTTGWKESD